jgi:hypothetical protein
MPECFTDHPHGQEASIDVAPAVGMQWDGGPPAKDKYGICLLCPKRIVKKSDGRAHQGGRAHHSCVLGSGTHRVYAPESQEVVEEQVAATLAIMAPAPLVPPSPQLHAQPVVLTSQVTTEAPRRSQRSSTHTLPLLLPQHPWLTHSWKLFTPQTQTEPMALQWRELFSDVSARSHLWQGMQAGARQFDTAQEIGLRGPDGKRETLNTWFSAVCLQKMQDLGVEDPLQVMTIKMLHAPPGTNAQRIHYDVRDKQIAKQCYSCLLYTDETTSAMVPKLNAEMMAPAFVPSGNIQTAEVQAVCDALCAPHNFISFPVHSGSMLVFRGDTAHAGTRNATNHDRIVLFALIAPRGVTASDASQRFPVGKPDELDDDNDEDEPRSPPLKRVRREQLHEFGIGTQGKSRPPSTTALSLLHITDQVKQGLSLNQAINKIATIEHTSPRSLRQAIQFFTEKDEVPIPSTANRGKGNPTHSLHSNNTDEYGPSLEAEILIHTLVARQKTEGISITSTTIRAELRDKLMIDVHRSTVRRWMHMLEYRWRHKRYVGGMKPQAKNIRIRQFIMEIAHALKEEADGTAVIVYVDESYIHTHHASKYGWLTKDDRDVIGDRDGKRLIILHAMTETGMLAVPGEAGTNWMSEVALTAEVVFEEVLEDGQDDSDYHNTMNGPKFINWVRNRLLPTFTAMYPHKKMFLVLDNASYHKPRDESWISNSQSMNKHELVHQLLDLGVEQITTQGDRPRVILAHQYGVTIGQGGPSKNDLLAAVNQWLEDHPDHNQSVVEQLMGDAKHAIIYTPPFCPEVQPIELLWAKVKRHVADQATHNRSITETRQQTEQAFEAITSSFCISIIKHTHDWMDEFIQNGKSEDLRQCGSLAGVIKHLPLLRLADAKPQQEHSEVVPMVVDMSVPAAAPPSSATKRTLRKRH